MSDINYVLIDKHLPLERIYAWYDKIRVYHIFEPNYLSMLGKVTVWSSFADKEGITMTVNEANALPKQNIPPTYHVLEKTIDLGEAYMWKKNPLINKDEIDLQFEKDQNLLRINLFGLHTYGGYYGFFRPDLSEVIHLLDRSTDPLLEFDRVKRVYVTTEPYPSDTAIGINGCYDSKADRHRARTECYVVSSS